MEEKNTKQKGDGKVSPFFAVFIDPEGNLKVKLKDLDDHKNALAVATLAEEYC